MQRREFLRRTAAATAWAALPRRAGGRAKVILYCGGPVTTRLVEELMPSRFDVVILAFGYARTVGGRLRISYNGIAPSRAAAVEGPRLRRLRQRKLLSLGGWGNAGTFAAIRRAGVEPFLDVLDRELVGPLGLEGLDLDLEPGTAAENTAAGWHAVHDEYGATLVELTREYRRRHPGHVVTHAPIASVAAALYARDGRVRGVRGSLVEACGGALSWLNVQCYEAGDQKPLTIPEYYRREGLDPRFYFPGFEPRRHQTLAFCEATLRALPGAGGTFLWDYRQIAGEVGAWGRGLSAALG